MDNPFYTRDPLEIEGFQGVPTPQVAALQPQPTAADQFQNLAVNTVGSKAIEAGMEKGIPMVADYFAPLMDPASLGMAQAVGNGAASGAGSAASMLAAQNAGLQGAAGLTAEALGAGTAGTAAATGGAAAGGAMSALGTAMPWLGAGLVAGKMFGLFNKGGMVGPLGNINMKSKDGEQYQMKFTSPLASKE